MIFLVTGGAGTGKSAIGLQVKAELEAQGRTVKYASGSRAFNGALQEHVGYGDRQFRETFTYFSSFVTPPDPLLDVLICDEAHRLRDRSISRFWKPEQQGTGPQVDELLAASRLTVFFLDEGQSVRPNEVGTVDLIKDAAERHDALVVPYKLREQYRCGGSDAYVRWVKALLGVTGEEPGKWRPDGLMHIEVADTPEELEQTIRTEALAGASARMVAGYCWPWTKPLGKERRLEADVRIGEWHRPWNADSESFCEDEAPPSRIWSVHENGLGQIGCVYTAQGLEWDWCGVIMGDDMVRRGDRWVFRRGKELKTPEPGIKRVAEPGSFDPKVKAGSVDDDGFARLVRHAYHVLMTRASRATVLYSTDQETGTTSRSSSARSRSTGCVPHGRTCRWKHAHHICPGPAEVGGGARARRGVRRVGGLRPPSRGCSDKRCRKSEVAGSPGPPPVRTRRADLQSPPRPSPKDWRRLRRRTRSGSRGSVHDAHACTRPRSWPLQSSEIGMAGGRPTGHPRSRRMSPHDGHNHSSPTAHWGELRNRSLVPSGKVRSAIMVSREDAPGGFRALERSASGASRGFPGPSSR